MIVTSPDPVRPTSKRIPRAHSSRLATSRWEPLLHRYRASFFAGPIIYTLIAFAFTANTWFHPTSQVVGTGGDPYDFLWALQWPAFAIAHGHNPFFSTYLIAPQGTNLMWSDSTAPGIILGPVVSLLGPVLVYNLIATLSLAMSAWFAQLAIHRFVPSWFAAFVGGLLFGFSPYMMGHAWGHVVITMAFFPPLMLILLHEMFVRQRWRWWVTGGLAGLLLALQYVTFIETIVITALAAGLAMVIVAVQRPQAFIRRVPHALRAGLVMLITFVVVDAYPLRTMFFDSQRLGHGTVEPPDAFVTDVVNFIVPTVTTRFAPTSLFAAASHIGGGVESGAYLGIPIISICILTTVVLWRHLVVRTAALVGLILAVLSLGPHLHVDGTITKFPLPFDLLSRLPLVDNILAARFMGVADLCVGILVAFFIQWLRKADVGWYLLGLAWLCFGLFLIIPVTTPTEPYSIPTYFTSAAVDKIPQGSTALVAPFDWSGPQDGPQLWQAASGFRFRMPEGYVYVPNPTGPGPSTGPLPTPFSLTLDAIFAASPQSPAPQITPADRSMYLAQISAWHATTVLVGPMPNQGVMVNFFTQLLGRPGHTQGGVTAWYHVGS